MKGDSAKMATFSDVHLGHHNTKSAEIIPNLRHAFRDTEVNNQLDFIAIVGDLFDRELRMGDEEQVGEIMLWGADFLRWAKKRNIVIRVLEGTKSHDWGQNWLLQHINEMAQIGADIKYVPTLSIEYIECIDRTVLWVPDDWRPDPDTTWSEIRQLMQEQNLDKVDIAMVHGAFEHQLPEVANAHPHKLDRYLGIARDFVVGGHIHLPGAVEHFRCNGSFDRICHGEEGDKGHWRYVLNRQRGNTTEFIINEGAKKYVTVEVGGFALEDAMGEIRSQLRKLPSGSYVRIRANKGDPVLAVVDQLKKDYPLYTWSTKTDDQKQTQTNLLVDMRTTFHAVQITPENVIELLMEQVARKHTQDPAKLALCRQQLERSLSHEPS